MNDEKKQMAITILHVDDEPNFLAVSKIFLEKEGFKVNTAHSAEKGIELLKGGNYEVVLSDYQMPNMDGLEFLQKLRESGNGIPFIIFTGRGREEVAIEALNKGANHYLQKGGDIKSMYGTLAHAIREEVEKKRAEDKLAAVEKEQQMVLDSVPAMMFHVDRDSNYLYANQLFADTCGITLDDFKGKSTESIFPKDSANYIKDDKEVLKSGIPKIGIIREIGTPNGPRWLRTDKIPVNDADGNVTGIIGFALDITQQKKSEAALQASEKQLRETKDYLDNIINSSADAITVVDMNGIVQDWNKGAESIMGYSAGEVIGTSSKQLFVDPEEVDRIMERVDKEGAIERYRAVVLRKDGKPAHLSISAALLRDKNGVPIGTVRVSRDVTKVAELEKRLKEDRDNLNMMLESMADGVYLVSKDYKIEFMNRVLREEFGNHVGDICYKALHGRDEPCPRCKLSEVMKGETERWEWHSGNRDKTYDLIETPLTNVDGTLSKLTIFRDITERQKAEEILRKSKDHLELIFRKMPSGVFTIDLERRITSWSLRAEQLTGLKVKDVMGKKCTEIWNCPSCLEQCSLYTEDVEKPIYGKECPITIDDRTFMASKNVDFLKDEEGNIIGGLETFEDITEQKRVEEALRASEQQLREIFESMADGVYLVSEDYKIEFMNRVLREEFGDHVGDICYKALHSRKDPCPLCKHSEVMKGETARWEWHSGKMDKTYDLIETPLKDVNGTLSKLTIFRDITERRKAEEAIKKSKEHLDLIFWTMPSGVFTVDLEKMITSWSLCAEQLTGLKAEDVLGKKCIEIWNCPSCLEQCSLYTEDVEKPIYGKECPITIGERTLTASKNVDFLKDEEGNIIGGLETFEDITERKRVEEALRAAESHLREIFESMADGVYLVSKDYKIEFMNRVLRENFGDHVGDICYKAFHGREDPCPLCKLSEVMKGKTVRWEWDSGRGDKVYDLVETPLTNVDGTISKLTIFRDITGWKQTEEELRESKERLSSFMDTATDSFTLFDSKLNFLEVDKTALDILQLNREDIIRKNILDVLPTVKENGRYDQYMAVIKTGKPFFEDDFVSHPTLGDIHLAVRAFKVGNGLGVINTDITERKHAEMEREHLLRELEAKSAEMERFTYTVSHDLRSPLFAIQGFTNLAREDLEQGKLENVASELERTENAATKMDRLLHDTLQLSRIGRVVNPPEDVPFGEIVEEALEQTAEHIKSSGTEISTANDFPTVHVDRMRIVEILVNLITNSIKYRDEQQNPQIEIEYRVEGEDTVFFVKDNGMGIDLGQHEKVFELFYQVDRSGNGIGAGLAIVKRIVEVHGGRIWIESEKEKGCTVCFTLPVA